MRIVFTSNVHNSPGLHLPRYFDQLNWSYKFAGVEKHPTSDLEFIAFGVSQVLHHTMLRTHYCVMMF